MINMDETAVCLYQGPRKGTIIASKKRKRDGPVQRVSHATTRTYLTHVAFICDDPYYQQFMPQVVIGNEHTLLVRDMPLLKTSCPSRFTLVRQRSAWNNAKLMGEIVEKLGVALAPYANTVQPILLMDAAKLHWTGNVMTKCTRKGVWPLPVPARLTWLLQPCDTHMFQLYKLHLRTAYQRKREQAGIAGPLAVNQVLDCVYETTECVVEDTLGWKHAFREDGFGAKQTQLSGFRKRQMELEANPEVGAQRPSIDQVKLCFPVKQKPPAMSQLFRCSTMQDTLRGPSRMPVLPPAAGAPRGFRLPGPALARTFAGREPRTRSEHRQADLARGRPSGS